MIEIASKHGIKLQIGAQVGETAILLAVARHLNLAQEAVLYSEGSLGPLHFTEDISKESFIWSPWFSARPPRSRFWDHHIGRTHS